MAKPGKHVEMIGKLIKDIDIAMLTTVGPDGYLVSRPLSTQDTSFDGKRVWFFTQADSPKVEEIERNSKVNLAYASADKNTYVSLAGDASVSRDRRRINALWNDAMKAFFPGGKNDPNLVLLSVELRTAEYWDGPGSLLGKLVTFVVARVTKNEEVMGTNRLVDFSPRVTSRLPPSHADAPRGARKAAKRTLKSGPATGKKRGATAKGAKPTTRKAAKGKAASKASGSRKAAVRKTTSTRPASPSKAARPPATSKSSSRSKASKTSKTAKTSRATKATKATKATRASKPSKSTKATKASKASKASKGSTGSRSGKSTRVATTSKGGKRAKST